MTYRQPLRWLFIDSARYSCWMAAVTHATYEARSHKPKVWRAYRNGRVIGGPWMSRNAAIAFIEAGYYDDRQMPTTVNVRRKNAAI